jgi:translation initiation factor IF-3
LIKRYKQQQEKRYRINQRIFASSLRVLDSENKQIGVLSKDEALKLAQEQGLDLVEIAPMAKPPVAKLID